MKDILFRVDDMIHLEFSDGSRKEFAKGVTAEQVVKELFRKKEEKAIAAKLNGRLIDLTSPLEESGDFDVITFDDPQGTEVLRHSSSHIMALAIKRLFPGVKVTIGPSVEDGFYYDFDNLKLGEDDFKKVEDEINKVLHEKLQFSRNVVSKQEALSIFKDEPYKLEIINELPEGETISIYKVGEFVDLCRGPHVPTTGKIGAIKLMKVAGAYWRGDSKNKMLTRVYGTSFPDKKMLNDYLQKLEEAKKRDHRKIGKDLQWFFSHEYSPGSPFFMHKGAIIYNELVNFMRTEYFKRGYQEVITPLMYDKALWETSGHWEHYKDDMFTLTVDGREFGLKPMNCPSHCLIYQEKLKSYRDLPLRIADFAPLHRNELKGVLGGLTRVRKFAQDDSHIFCAMEQIEDEMSGVLDFIKYVFNDVFRMELLFVLSTRPEKAMGTKEAWDKAEAALENALKKHSIKYAVNPGDGAFYGPKIDMKVKDSLGREWQLATLQLDFNLPERFDLEYEGKDGLRHRPVMIHRAILGSIERFMGVYIEHTAGKLPLWLSPVQARVLPIADRHQAFAHAVEKQMRDAGLRVEVDERSESVSKKVRDAQVDKVNYILVVGDKELDENKVNVRTRNNEVQGSKDVSELIQDLLREVATREIR